MLDFVNPVALATLAISLAAFTAIWGLSVALRNAAVVDVYWAAGFPVIAFVSWWLAPGPGVATLPLILAAVSLWAVRLQAHLSWRFLQEQHEDARYAKFRADAGPGWWLRSLPQVFWLQAVLMWIVATPLHAAALSAPGSAIPLATGIGGVVFLVGFVVEAVADWQLARHRSNVLNAGRTLREGLWAWSRRPNYVGEALVWIGLGLVALGGGAPWWAMVGPVVLVAILFGVTGPLTEQHLRSAKRDYADYAATVPLLPAKPRTDARETVR